MNGLSTGPRSRIVSTRAFMMKAKFPKVSWKRMPRYPADGSVSSGKRPADQSNVPPSTITPPIEVPWPPMNFVAEWITMCAPCSNGRHRYGVANVLSITSGTPASSAMAAQAAISSTSMRGFPIVSA